jgi:hypothetical protein
MTGGLLTGDESALTGEEDRPLALTQFPLRDANGRLTVIKTL